MLGGNSKLELGKEYPEDDEESWIRCIIDRLRTQMEHEYTDTRMLRDAHPKQHGCVRAEFTIEPDLPPELAVGLFRKPNTFSAWIRFSNSAPRIRPDDMIDIRGMAIQLTDVEGNESQTQDFLLLSSPIFLTRDVKQFDGFVKAANGGLLPALLYFLTPLPSRIALIFRIWKTAKSCDSLLSTRFWSTTPYAFGDRAMKYSVTPRTPEPTTTGDSEDPNFLRSRLAADLVSGEAMFDFSVQFQTDPQSMPIEDPTVEWDESDSAFRKVATLRIPAQNFDTTERDEFGDNLTFNPWHCLPEHRPLGGINRGRKEIYPALARFRLQRNGVIDTPNEETN
jgi:hypothetical protein